MGDVANRKLRIYVGGSASGNPDVKVKRGACAYIIKSVDRDVTVSSGSRRLGTISTCNTSQYQGLILGMRACMKLKIKDPTELEFVSDLELSMNQMNDIFAVDEMEVFYQVAKGIEKRIKDLPWVKKVSFSHIARLENKDVHELAKKQAKEEIDLENFNFDALTYYPNLCSQSSIKVSVAKGNGLSSEVRGSNDDGCSARDQAMFMDAEYLASVRGLEFLQSVEDPGDLSWISNRGPTLEVLGKLKAIQCEVKLNADDPYCSRVFNLRDVVVVHRLPVPFHIHVVPGPNGYEEYDWPLPSANCSRAGLMEHVHMLPRGFQGHPFWHKDTDAIFIPAAWGV